VSNQPDYWAAIPKVHGGRHSGAFDKIWKDEHYQVDDDSPVPGAKSVRMSLRLELRNTQVTAQHVRRYAFSCYLKSDKDDYQASLTIGHYDKRHPATNVTVGKDWKRYHLSGMVYKGTWFAAHWQVICVGVHSKSDGVLWIAAPQLEFGIEPSPYQPADADAFVVAEIEKHVKFPVTKSTVVQGRRPPRIEDVVGPASLQNDLTGPLVSDHDASAVPQGHLTRFHVLHDEYNLYVYVRCDDPRVTGPDWVTASANTTWKPNSEWGKILYDNSAILYLKPDFYDEDHFTFGIRPDGERMDTHVFEFTWESADWQAETILRKGYWGARFTVPFYVIMQLTGPKALGETLGVNLRRFETTEETVTAKGIRAIDGTLRKSIWFWSPDRFTRLPGAFGKLGGIDTSKVRACRVKDARLALAENGRVDAVVEIDRVPVIDEQAFLRVDLTHAEGEHAARIVPFALDGRAKTMRIKGVTRGWKAGDWRLSVHITDVAARTIGKTARRAYVPETFRLLDNDLVLTLERSYYTSEEQARALLQSRVGRSLDVEVALETGAEKPIAQEPLCLEPKGRAFLTFDLKDLPEGRHKVTVSVSKQVTVRRRKQKRLVLSAHDFLHRVKPAPEGTFEVKVDRFRRILLVDGRPMIAMAMGVADPERFHAMYAKPNRRAAQGGLARAIEAGMPVIPWGGGWGNFAGTESFVGLPQEHGAKVLAYMYHDEPGLRHEPKLRAQYEQIRKLDPYRPAFFLPGPMDRESEHRGPAGIHGASDIYCKSGYPWGSNSTHYTLGQTHYYSLQAWTDVTRRIGTVVREQCIIGGRNLGTWVGNDRYRLSTPQQNRCLVYTGLANGHRFFSWWPGRPQSDVFWNSLIDLRKEMDKLAPILGDSDLLEEDHGERDHVQYALWSGGGKTYLIVANPWVEARTFTYTFPERQQTPAVSVSSISEPAPAPVLRDGQLTLEMEPYDCGVYRVSAP